MTKKILRHLRAKMFAGILVILPLGITFLVLKFVFNSLDSILGPVIPNINVFLFRHAFQLPYVDSLAFCSCSISSA